MDDLKGRIKEICKRLAAEYPEPGTALHHENPFELLVATILSAQTTDARVNKVTAELFKKYRRPEDFAEISPEALAQEIKSVNFFNNKAKNIVSLARILMTRFGGDVPKTMEELTLLPGVARKTANIVLASAYGINEGIAVDTHVKRLAGRLGLTLYADPVKIERDLMASTPQRDWGNLSHLLIFHGRRVCAAKKPRHDICVLFDICPSNGI